MSYFPRYELLEHLVLPPGYMPRGLLQPPTCASSSCCSTDYFACAAKLALVDEHISSGGDNLGVVEEIAEGAEGSPGGGATVGRLRLQPGNLTAQQNTAGSRPNRYPLISDACYCMLPGQGVA